MPTLYTLVAPCFFGTESTLHFEIKRLGAQNIQVTDGRIAFQGGADLKQVTAISFRVEGGGHIRLDNIGLAAG